MSFVFKAIAGTLRDLVRFKIAWIMVWPILASIFFWLIIDFVFQDSVSEWIFWILEEIGIWAWLQGFESGWITSGIQGLIHVLMFIPLVIITTLIITSIFVMPALIKLVADRYYPGLKRENGGTISGSIINAVLASGVFVLIWVVTLPLWAIGAGIAVPFVAAAFMNQQLFRYDALSEHASQQEIRQICADNRYSLWGLGMLTGLIQFVPLLNLLAPVVTALAFIHFGLAHLKQLRAENAIHSEPQ